MSKNQSVCPGPEGSRIDFDGYHINGRKYVILWVNEINIFTIMYNIFHNNTYLCK
jgi:hypothetical protein